MKKILVEVLSEIFTKKDQNEMIKVFRQVLVTASVKNETTLWLSPRRGFLVGGGW